VTQDAGATPPVAISIVVPVFRDLNATRKCLESVLNSDLAKHVSITVINDHSPEPELHTYCRELASAGHLKLIVNEQNLGFVKTANRGIALEPDADILLLNSDTVVCSDWLQRLQRCAYRLPRIGTVTPFSNNGTICSYPVSPVSNSLPSNWSAAELDGAFKTANQGAFFEIPTAVGFCMYIKRSCLNETGPFDEANFGHGYGEECDFSLRANALRWVHVVAADVFVYHEGGASFASESMDRKRHADKVMNQLHPHYHKLISDFLQSDPLYVFRRNVDAVRLSTKPSHSAEILDEHLRYTRILLDRVAEFHDAMLGEREEREALGKMLDDCRMEFARTDRALAEAEMVVNDLTGYLEDARIYAEQLQEHIATMEQSRSWRYTAWLRRKS
jgi:GT2 family glycosyltransferase